jgi:uncharacterized protein (TIGR01244 family)
MKEITQEIHLSPAITLGPQLTSSDAWEELSHRGTKTVVSLSRKDELGLLKPHVEEALVTQHGMNFLHFPVSISSMKPQDVDEFLVEIRKHETPLYMHCRIGQRSGPFGLILHAMRQRLPLRHVMERAQRLGLVWRSPLLNEFVANYLEHKSMAAAA